MFNFIFSVKFQLERGSNNLILFWRRRKNIFKKHWNINEVVSLCLTKHESKYNTSFFEKKKEDVKNDVVTYSYS